MGNSKNISFGILDSINKKNISTDNDISNDVDKNSSDDINKNNSNDNTINNNIDNNNTVNKNINNDNVISNDVNRNVSSSNDGNNIGNIVIKKTITSDKPKRVSYYLKEKTISDIEKLAKKSGMGISEFLQYYLDITLDKIEIR
jgi:hypothetical protein